MPAASVMLEQGRAVSEPVVVSSDLAALCQRAASGELRAFRLWVEQATPVLFRLALRLLGSEPDAQDLVQEVCVRAWRGGLEGLRDPGASLGWACAVTRNLALDLVRQRRRRRSVSLDEHAREGRFPIAERLASGSMSPEEVLGSAQARAFVRAVIEGLPEKHRLVLLLREVDGLSYEEVAAALGCPVGTVDSRLNRAREALKKKIQVLSRPGRWRFWS